MNGPARFECRDVTGEVVAVTLPVKRAVSLVPAITETVFALGAGEALVGRTRYCIKPVPDVRAIETVGGTKDPNVARIIALAPDIVLANREENVKRDVDALRTAGVTVHVAEPQTPDDALRSIALYASLFDCVEKGLRIVVRGEAVLEQLRRELAQAAAADALRLKPRGKPRVVCFIWRNPWMAVGRDTFIGSMIETLGGVNVFADAKERYFEIPLADAAAASPDIILLPSEPYHFKPDDVEELRAAFPQMPASRNNAIRLCDGEDLSWAGARTPDALLRLRPLFV